jgi:UDP-2-acetamido-3-amino-2,3-dideoxy-glucuronate N-acetyltransferase
MIDPTVQIHPSADVSPDASVGPNTRIWHRAHVREGAAVGAECILGKDVYVDAGVKIGSRVKIQNGALIYHGVTIDDGVFIGPQACLANDLYPRAITPEGGLKTAEDWTVEPILVKYGASVGAGCLILPGVVVGRFAMVGAGSVVTRDVPEHALVVGVPAKQVGFVCRCGRPMLADGDSYRCQKDGWVLRLGEQS